MGRLELYLALFSGLWFAVALWLSIAASRRVAEAGRRAREAARAEALLAAGPAIPLIATRDGRIEAPRRLAVLLGVAEMPLKLADVAADGAGLTSAALEELASRIKACAAQAAPFALTLPLAVAGRVVTAQGAPAPSSYPAGAVLIWFEDRTEAAQQRTAIEHEAERSRAALDALSALIEAAPFPIWHRDPELRLAMANGAYVRAVEARDAKGVVEQGIELIDESEGRSPAAHAALVRDAGEPMARTVPATLAGERRMLRVLEVPLVAGGVAGYAIDVEEREQARAELARFVQAQREMLDRLSAGVAQFDRDRSLIFFNQPFARMFALAPELLAEQPEFDRMLEAMREGGNLPGVRHYPEWREERRAWFTSGLEGVEEEWLLPGGKHLRVVAQPLPDGGLLLIFEDRTEQVQLASARDTLLRVRTATFDNLFEAVGVFASDGRLSLWNNRFRELWQFEETQLANSPRIDSLVPHIATKLKNHNHAGLVRELVRSATVERKQRSGRVSLTDGRDFEFAAVPLPDGNALFTMLDVTHSRMIEVALRERAEALEDADRLKTAFVSNMSYELRTPLTSIAGFAEMLAAGYAGNLEAQAADYVQAILNSVSRLSALIDNVLDLTQSDGGSLLIAEEEVDLKALMREAAATGRELAATQGITFHFEVKPSIGSITGDRRRLRQAIDNLVKNGVLRSNAGGRVSLRGGMNKQNVEIVVEDDGPSIAPADQARAFDRFHRGGEAGRDEEASLTLALPLAKQFIEAHGGRITLQSGQEKGLIVTVRLPSP